ncbi:hypothetical protein K1T71_010506 [Dendrolimus kikuchii]|uniref:Uncharacterized protein n=1 Tax=Dendrolimus kikuchii TaxID=765133 RepID=A0ACC1CRX7_9NEOP|nr:hypothetical protein K1T71_010506 [Dendrolimus kikuchii]
MILYTQAPKDTLHDAIKVINDDLNRIHNWSTSHGLSVNPGKTQAIIIGSSRTMSQIDFELLPDVMFHNSYIPISDQVKNLGVIIDKELCWRPHITELSRKIFASYASLRRLKKFLPTATKISLVQAIILPILDYADACYLNITQEQLIKLERLQNVCIRFIFGLKKYDHISEYRKKLKWLPISLRRNAHLLNLLYRTLFIPYTPPYLKECFNFLHTSHTFDLRSSNNLLLKAPAHSSTFYSKSFAVQAVCLWNSLPVDVRKAKSLAIFKKSGLDRRSRKYVTNFDGACFRHSSASCCAAAVPAERHSIGSPAQGRK